MTRRSTYRLHLKTFNSNRHKDKSKHSQQYQPWNSLRFFFTAALVRFNANIYVFRGCFCCASVSGFFKVEMFLFDVFFVWFIAFAMFLFDVFFHLLKHSQFGTGRAHWQPILGQHTHARRLELSVRDSDCPRTLQSTGQGKGFGLFGAPCPSLVSKG